MIGNRLVIDLDLVNVGWSQNAITLVIVDYEIVLIIDVVSRYTTLSIINR